MMRIVVMLLIVMAAAAQAQVRLYVFDCGSLSIDDVGVFGLSNDETTVRELFVPCYLVEHRTGGVQRLLFDAGLPPAVAGQGEVALEPGTTMRYRRTLEEQLTALDLTPADIDYVAFSHLHFDHVGSAGLFTESLQLIQSAEFQAGFVEQNARIYQPDLFLGLADSPRRLLDGDHDVFGDGSVRLISAPGHTPGHQALLVRLVEPGPVVLSGDLYHFRRSRERRRVPLFNTNQPQTLASMDKVEALLEREGATLWIEHDKALADTLRKAPGYYE
jgi:glyoxylase-like metal-dependent hydrolase (beta-lactamase superfamily II)